MSCAWCDKDRSTHVKVGRYIVCPMGSGPGPRYVQGVEDERANIVAWLRDHAGCWDMIDLAAKLADQIESGSHLKGNEG